MNLIEEARILLEGDENEIDGEKFCKMIERCFDNDEIISFVDYLYNYSKPTGKSLIIYMYTENTKASDFANKVLLEFANRIFDERE